MAQFSRITPFLWFDSQAEEAANFYTSVFPNSRIGDSARTSEEAAQHTGRPVGSVMTINFELDGQKFTALNGGPVFKFTEAVSFVVNCAGQEEIDHYWSRLGEGGDPASQQCGWLKDRFGLSWQIVPAELPQLMTSGRGQQVMHALMQMKKLDLAVLREAAADRSEALAQ
jgi:predicted 3-demethylubiquinone-9 3-methyltransferase (glyoxalase superfamily)